MRKTLIVCLALAGVACVAASPQSELDKLLPWRRSSKAERRSLAQDTTEVAKLKEEEEKEEATFKWTCVVGILALAATFAFGHVLESQHINRLPEAGVGVLMGMVASAAASYFGNDVMVKQERFDFEFFMVYLLPPIIFEAGFNMNVKAFIDNIGPTMFFAFAGTFASTFVVGGIVWYAGQLGLCYPLGLLSALVFGSLISATDPVTVLAVFQKLGVKIDLFSMVFGESVLNDAVAIVLSKTLLSFNDPKVEVNLESIFGAVKMFVTIFVGSLIIGLIYGIVSALAFKKLNLRHHDDAVFVEAALSFTFPWAAYYTAEANNFSGIVTILFCGMVMATYTRFNFSDEAHELVARAYKCVALLAETYVFVYLGMAVFSFPIFDHTVWKCTVIALFACFVGRLHIYVGSCLFNCGRKTAEPGAKQVGMPKISGAYQFVMWFSGLRGGVAFALASVSYAAADFPHACMGLALEDAAARAAQKCDDSEMTDSLAIMQVTLLIAAFTIFVFGGAITEVATAYNVIEKQSKKKRAHDETPPVDTAWSVFNKMILMPWLTFTEEVKEQQKEEDNNALRDKAAMSKRSAPVEEENASQWHITGTAVLAATKMKSSAQIKNELFANADAEAVEMALKGVTSVNEMSMQDKIDEVRMSLPKLSTDEVRKLIQDNDGDVEQAVKDAQSRGFV